jgi:DNA polymerase-3 subunit alpha
MLLAERRANGPFRDSYELCSRLEPGKMNKTMLENLARANALSSFDGTRASQVAAVDQALEWGQRVWRDRQAGQSSLFGTPGEGFSEPAPPPRLEIAEFNHSELLGMEKDLLGVYLSGHPLEAEEAALREYVTASCREVNEGEKLGEVVLGGIVTSLRRRVTKRGTMMAFVTLEDLTGVAELVIWSETYERSAGALADGAIVVMKGKAEVDERWREEKQGATQTKVIVDGIARLNDPEAVKAVLGAVSRNGRRTAGRNGGNPRKAAPPAAPQEESPMPSVRKANSPPPTGSEVHIRLPGDTDQKTLGLLKGLIDQCRGDACVCLHVECEEGARRIRLASEYGVAFNDKFTLGVQGILGEGAAWVGE